MDLEVGPLQPKSPAAIRRNLSARLPSMMTTSVSAPSFEVSFIQEKKEEEEEQAVVERELSGGLIEGETQAEGESEPVVVTRRKRMVRSLSRGSAYFKRGSASLSKLQGEIAREESAPLITFKTLEILSPRSEVEMKKRVRRTLPYHLVLKTAPLVAARTEGNRGWNNSHSEPTGDRRTDQSAAPEGHIYSQRVTRNRRDLPSRPGRHD